MSKGPSTSSNDINADQQGEENDTVMSREEDEEHRVSNCPDFIRKEGEPMVGEHVPDHFISVATYFALGAEVFVPEIGNSPNREEAMEVIFTAANVLQGLNY